MTKKKTVVVEVDEDEEQTTFNCCECNFYSTDKDESREHWESEHLIPNQRAFDEAFGEDL